MIAGDANASPRPDRSRSRCSSRHPVPASARQMVGMGPAQGEFPMMLPPGKVAKTGTGRLRGRIVAADTGAIVRRAQVRISSPDIGSKTAFTDAQGRYEFRDLPAGRFNAQRLEVRLRDDAVRAEPAVRVRQADRAGRRAGDGQGGRRPAARQRRIGTHPRRIRRAGRRRERAARCACSTRRAGKRGWSPSGRAVDDQRSRAVPAVRPAARRVLRQRRACARSSRCRWT